jgi:tRNA U34 5-methylaminomethyl-2-thiouridine-forming methyltransferase MnmC
MKKVITADGSCTFHSDEYDETYHSVSGALDEALRKFVEPCKIADNMNVLDIGFGLGYNAGMAAFKAKKLKIVSLEKDEKVLAAVNNIEVPDWFNPVFEKIKCCAKNLSYKDDDVEIQIIVGDAKETIKKINEKFDAVFLDPFSPPKNPELWTADFFPEIKKRMNLHAKIATYSCASQIRKNLKIAGFQVEDGPCVGRRAPSTLASFIKE